MAQFTIFSANYYSIATEIGTGIVLNYNAQAESASNPFYGSSIYSEQTGTDDNNIVPNETLTADYVAPLGTDAIYLGTISYTSPDDGVTRTFLVIDDAFAASILLGSPIPNLDYVHFPPTFTPAQIQTTSFVPCFLAGTLIDTPEGPRAVEVLDPGDRILTADGRAVRLRFNFRKTLDLRFGPADSLRPVEITAGALGNGLPERPLRVTADHGMLVEGYLINAGALVNGTTIRRVPMLELEETYTVHHLETDAHDIILAEGAPSETFIDYAGRQQFDNFEEFTAVYGPMDPIPENMTPRITTRDQLPFALQHRLGVAKVA